MRYRQQPRLKGGREPIWGALDPKIKQAVVDDSRKFRCSKSFIVNTALGVAMGIKTEHYYEIDPASIQLRRVK